MNASTNDSLYEASRPLEAQICLSVGLFILMALAIGGNMIIFLAIYRNALLRAQVANIFIVNLALTDFGCAVLVMPFSLVSVWEHRWVLSAFWCDAVCLLNYGFIIVSMLTLALISVDRRIYVLQPMRYDLTMTRGHALALALLTWLVGLAFAVPPAGLGWVEYDDSEIGCAINWGDRGGDAASYAVSAVVVCFLLPIVVMVVSYWGIWRVARRHSARVAPVPPVRPGVSPNAPLETGRGGAGKRPGAKRRAGAGSMHVTRAVKPILTMVVVYLVCNTPFNVTKLVKAVMRDNRAVPSYVSTLAAWLAFSKPACNPVIYSMMRKNFRVEVFKILPKCCSRLFVKPKTRQNTDRTVLTDLTP